MDKEKAEQLQGIAAQLQAAGCAMTSGTCGCLMLVGILLVLLMLLG